MEKNHVGVEKVKSAFFKRNIHSGEVQKRTAFKKKEHTVLARVL